MAVLTILVCVMDAWARSGVPWGSCRDVKVATAPARRLVAWWMDLEACAQARVPGAAANCLCFVAQPSEVFPGCQMFRRLRMSLAIQAHNRRVRPTAAITDLYIACGCPPRRPGIQNTYHNAQNRHK